MAMISSDLDWQGTPFANPFTDLLTSLNAQTQAFSQDIAAVSNTRFSPTGGMGIGDWLGRNKNLAILVAGVVITAKLLNRGGGGRR